MLSPGRGVSSHREVSRTCTQTLGVWLERGLPRCSRVAISPTQTRPAARSTVAKMCRFTSVLSATRSARIMPALAQLRVLVRPCCGASTSGSCGPRAATALRVPALRVVDLERLLGGLDQRPSYTAYPEREVSSRSCWILARGLQEPRLRPYLNHTRGIVPDRSLRSEKGSAASCPSAPSLAFRSFQAQAHARGWAPRFDHESRLPGSSSRPGRSRPPSELTTARWSGLNGARRPALSLRSAHPRAADRRPLRRLCRRGPGHIRRR